MTVDLFALAHPNTWFADWYVFVRAACSLSCNPATLASSVSASDVLSESGFKKTQNMMFLCSSPEWLKSLCFVNMCVCVCVCVCVCRVSMGQLGRRHRRSKAVRVESKLTGSAKTKVFPHHVFTNTHTLSLTHTHNLTKPNQSKKPNHFFFDVSLYLTYLNLTCTCFVLKYGLGRRNTSGLT